MIFTRWCSSIILINYFDNGNIITNISFHQLICDCWVLCVVTKFEQTHKILTNWGKLVGMQRFCVSRVVSEAETCGRSHKSSRGRSLLKNKNTFDMSQTPAELMLSFITNYDRRRRRRLLIRSRRPYDPPHPKIHNGDESTRINLVPLTCWLIVEHKRFLNRLRHNQGLTTR